MGRRNGAMRKLSCTRRLPGHAADERDVQLSFTEQRMSQR